MYTQRDSITFVNTIFHPHKAYHFCYSVTVLKNTIVGALYASRQIRRPRGAKEHCAERWGHTFGHQAILILRNKRKRSIEHTKTRHKIPGQGCTIVCYAFAYVSKIIPRCNHLI